ncbi:MAG: DEAD/DEAH box helicase family protein [Gammaproteobacteria bacterium]
MRYTLKDYQNDAVADVLRNLADARDDWQRKQRITAFSLTATTGAGKTVMAAAVIEALFSGNADYNFPADPGAVVLWFTDDPSLNEQTRFKLTDAADRINNSRLEVIGNSFSQEKLEPGKVYFLNSQKLSKNSLLVRGAPEVDPNDTQTSFQGKPPSPDARAHTMWDILSNTIEDENITLYLILDEAHRGMKSDRERATTVQKLINGTNGTPPIPVVLGISATVERFDTAMKQQQGRVMLPNVVVDPARVQESGLLKDDIRLDFPTETGVFDTVLLARATRKLRESTELWEQYAQREAAEDAVVPLLVVQVPNSPTDKLLLSAIDTIRQEWPELDADAMAHVFGEHKDIELSGFRIRYVPPEMVQDQTHIRVLFAKDAISTGWDCPRAEVFMSYRSAQDRTHITQLLGRMVRTPLARRIPGNDLLNSVTCVLPLFNRKTATGVAKAMTGDRVHDEDETGGGAGRRVLVDPVDMAPNPAIPEVVWKAFDALPCQTLPRKAAREITRYTAFAQALSRDSLRKNAVKEAYRELCKILDGLVARYPDKFEAAKADVLQVDGATIVVGVKDGDVEPAGTFSELADDRAIQADYSTAGRLLTPELAKRYAEHIAVQDEDDDGLDEAHIKVAALGKMNGVIVEALEAEADKLARKWFDEYRVAIKGLTDERQTVYDDIKGMSPEPQHIDLKRPYVRTEETKDIEGNVLETRKLHLMADKNGQFPIANLNDWEMQVLDKEMQRSDFLGWYRNPSRPSADALAIAWQDGNGNWRRMCPDFIFFHGNKKNVKVSLVDPHGIHLGDSLPKLRGLAYFVEAYGDNFHRIESIAQLDNTLRILDLKDEKVRQAIKDADDVGRLYRSKVAGNY